MKNKQGIIRLLKDAPANIQKMSVGKLLDKLSKELQKEKELEQVECDEICKKFRDSYIKKTDEALFGGDEMVYIYIEDIETGSHTTDYERLFKIKGHKITFSKNLNGSRELKMDETSFTQKELENSEFITQEDYKEVHKQLKIIRSVAKKMII